MNKIQCIFTVGVTCGFVFRTMCKTASVSRYIWVRVVHNSSRACPGRSVEICISPGALLPKEFKISCAISERGTDFTAFPRVVININTSGSFSSWKCTLQKRITFQKWIHSPTILFLFSFEDKFPSIRVYFEA